MTGFKRIALDHFSLHMLAAVVAVEVCHSQSMRPPSRSSRAVDQGVRNKARSCMPARFCRHLRSYVAVDTSGVVVEGAQHPARSIRSSLLAGDWGFVVFEGGRDGDVDSSLPGRIGL